MNEVSGMSRRAHTVSAAILQWFVDRERELRRFCDMLTGRDPTQVLVVQGPTGIGKTWLLRHLYQKCAAQLLPASTIDFASGEIFDDLRLVHRAALELGSHHFPTLNAQLDKATNLNLVLKVESSPANSDTFASGEIVTGGGAHIGGDVRVSGGDFAGRDIIKDNAFYFQADSPEMREVLLERINGAFFEDLARLGAASGAVLLFDSLEQAPHEASSWIENRLLRLIGDGRLDGVRVVIAGQHVPNFPLARSGLVAELRLDPLTAAKVREYLRDKRHLIISETDIATIHEVTDGRPDLVAMIADSPIGLPEKLDIDRLLAILVEGILETTQAPIPETLRLAAIAEWFDAALLAALLGTTTGVDDRLKALQVCSFIQDDGRGHLRFPPAVRHILLQTWAGHPTEFRELNSRAAHHFDVLVQDAADPTVREELERQAMGHWLIVDERKGRDRLRALFEDAEAAHRLTTCELLLQRAEAVAGLTNLTLDWLRYLRGRLAYARDDNDESAALFSALLAEIDPGSELHALAGWSLGQVNTEREEWAKAIDCYESSLGYFQGQANPARTGQVMLALGDVHLQQARALGELIRPYLVRRRGRLRFLQAIPSFLVAFPFVIYAWAIRRWRFLPPVHHGMNYRNWTLVRLLMTAAKWYRDAECQFATAGHEALLADARQRLAQTYHRLGWWRAAHTLFSQVLTSAPVVANAYRQAVVRKEFADTELATYSADEAIDQLEKSLKAFERYEDVQAQAQARALLGQAWLQKGEFERGLTLCRQSLEGFSSIRDRLGTGLALNALRRWMQESDPTAGQIAQVETLIASTSEKIYLPRVPDRLTAVLEFALSISLPLLAIVGLVAFSKAALMDVASMFSISMLLRLVGRLVLSIPVCLVGWSLVGLVLVSCGARRKFEPERLDRIVTSEDAITRYDYRGREVSRIPWHQVQAIVSLERTLWHTPIPLLSEFRLFSPETMVRVPGTMLWYDALKEDIEGHLRAHDVQPVRRSLDLHVLRSRTGLLFMLFPALLGLGGLIVYGLLARTPLPFRLAPGMAACIGPLLVILGQIALVAGPYWWLGLHLLWVHYELEPRSRLPLAAGSIGLVVVAFAFTLSYLVPFFPIRNWLDQTVHPLGFVLIIIASVWMLSARDWAQKPVVRGEPVHRPRVRVAAAAVLLGTVLLTGWFARREWIPYVYVLRAVTYFYHDDYEQTVTNSTQVLAMNAKLADGYSYRARAYSRLGKDALAIADLDHLIISGSAIAADYLARAEAHQALGHRCTACADLRSALGARDWPLSEEAREQTIEDWQQWNCHTCSNMLEGMGNSR